MRAIHCIKSRSPLLEPPKEVSILIPSFTIDDGIWLTVVSVPVDKRWDNYKLLEAFAHEGAYAIQWLTFGRV